MLNWKRKSSWTDRQNARFIYLIDGDGNFHNGETISQVRSTFQVKENLVKERVRQMGFSQYQFPLQRWIGAYEIYRIDAVEIPEKDAFMIEVQKLINEGKLAAEGSLEVGVVTMYLRNHFKPTNVPKRLKDAAQECGIWGILHRTARSFVEANRPAELDLFDDLYE